MQITEGNKKEEDEEEKGQKGEVVSGVSEGKWTDEEHSKFVAGLKLFGKNWNMIRQHVGTRTCP